MSSQSSTSNKESFCSRPLARRAYMAVAVGVAAFLVVQIALREPFRGYQTEVRLTGTASAAMDAEALRKWIKDTDPKAAVAISGGTSSRPQMVVRVGRIGARLPATRTNLETVARRVLIEHLPQAEAAHREGVVAHLERELQLARDVEERLVRRARELAERQRELESSVAAEQAPASESGRAIAPAPVATSSTEAATNESPLQTQLATLRLELSRLLANFTDEHPQVVAIRRQIANLEGQMDREAPAAKLEPAPAQSASFTSFPAADRAAEVSAFYPVAADELIAATAARQAAERKLHTTLASFSVHAPAAGWTAEPARLVTRLGGTPRLLPLLLSGLVAVVAGISMFRATRVFTGPAMLATTTDLARALPIPLVGQAPSPATTGRSKPQPWITPGRMQLLTRIAEIWLAAIVVACLAATCLDPSLGSQFATDPLGVLSEIVGRIAGR